MFSQHKPLTDRRGVIQSSWPNDRINNVFFWLLQHWEEKAYLLFCQFVQGPRQPSWCFCFCLSLFWLQFPTLFSVVSSLFLSLCLFHFALLFPVQKQMSTTKILRRAKTIVEKDKTKITVSPSSWSAPTGCLASSSACANPFSPSQSLPVWKEMFDIAAHIAAILIIIMIRNSDSEWWIFRTWE